MTSLLPSPPEAATGEYEVTPPLLCPMLKLLKVEADDLTLLRGRTTNALQVLPLVSWSGAARGASWLTIWSQMAQDGLALTDRWGPWELGLPTAVVAADWEPCRGEGAW